MRLPFLLIPAAGALAVLSLSFAHAAYHATVADSVTPDAVPALVAEAVKYQMEDFHHTSWGLRYRVHRVDSKDDSVRELIESADGNVARTLSHHGRPLSDEETAAEEKRLRALSATELSRRRRSADSSDKYGLELIGAFPHAMLFTVAPSQTQLPQFSRPQVVLNFSPNPQYHPQTTAQEVLPGIAGRMWIDAETHHLLRIELNVTKNLNLMFGILARVYQGGTLTYEQQAIGGGHYAYRNIDINVKLRELMVKVVPYHETLTATDITYLPTPPRLKEAVEMLLSSKP
ncbi:hypothetical protein Terro_1603 [Terriglobus roseus DSM 18391]|uniref:Uncharacterized protein n=1 Tax=Terriglobus roseus (strain DSM 18391 / NRRL B-41598 / KBS 63) TaxID=926566 RepID=I3ZF91_TERRK|nr:hypothetical protein [Terriglobus roseus]AFL87909.1 hypothetical protein Terro_1603 [Terriglobus roseus DSM 18391]